MYALIRVYVCVYPSSIYMYSIHNMSIQKSTGGYLNFNKHDFGESLECLRRSIAWFFSVLLSYLACCNEY